ncbi:MAG TPA: NAD(P)H-dependent oxidoreductase [Candidatus Bathyarchaeia archaeon]|jgi:chromate reductase|nr:NAD(P)H-dependent oxidoreductase [Candidatus Bathyarchaeia archaeon]
MCALKILGISGSARKGSYNWGLLEAAREMLPDDTALEIFDVSRFPLFTQDHERDPPTEVRLFKQKIVGADAILFATPEHNYTITAVLKNAIEWGNRPGGDNSWNGKPAAIISASSGPRGGARAQLHLRQILVDLNMFPINQPQLLLARAQASFDSQMKLKDPEAKEALRTILQALRSWTERIKGR